MNKILIAALAAAALAACDQSDSTVVADTNAAEANAATIVLPPSIAASKAYRCKDNSLLYIDWLSDGTARVKTAQNEIGTPVTVGEAAEDGAPSLTGAAAEVEAPSLTGDATATTVTYAGKTCHA